MQKFDTMFTDVYKGFTIDICAFLNVPAFVNIFILTLDPPEAGMLYKISSLTTALGVTKFVRMIVMILVTLCCAT